jgi:hypothetical protein
MYTALSIGFAFLLLAWGANGIRDRRERKLLLQGQHRHIADGVVHH